MVQPVPPISAKEHLWGRVGEGWDGSQSPPPRDLSGIYTPACAQWIRAPEVPINPAPQSSCDGPQAAFPRDAWADEGGGCFPGFLTALTSPTETPWAPVLPSLHEQDAFHHHLLGKAVSSATCSHRGSSKAAPPAAQDSLSLVLLLSKVTSKAPFPIS